MALRVLFFGWISDVIGRENTMAIVFSFGALAYWGLSEFGHTPYMFIIMAGLIFFTWGEIFSLFPATCTDAFGAKYAATNAGLCVYSEGRGGLDRTAGQPAQEL